MASLKPVFLFLFLSFLYFPTTIEATDPKFVTVLCTTYDTFALDSAFQLNLRTLLTSLSSNATGTTEFFNTTIADTSPADTVYGLFMCRGDVPSELCRECVINATQRLGGPSSDICPFSKGAIIWYEECMIRYSNRNFFSTVDTRPRIKGANPLNVSVEDREKFMTLLYTNLNETADEAAKAPVGMKKYATKEANISTSQTLYQIQYTLTQCTPDLTSQDCRRCLAKVIADVPWCCTYSIGGRVLYPSCNFRYEFFPFLSNSTAAAPSAQVPSAAKLEAKRKIKSSTIALIAVSTIATLPILFYLGCCFLKRKTRKSQKDILRENLGDEIITWESLQFDFATIEAATNKFSQENRIGKGGFGEVYKGVLKSNGEEIAVKRLSKRSEQGVIEFKNEVLLIAKLQHRNLVSLLGFCLEEEEKILVYEYVPNKSLDNFLFDHQEHRILNWSERYRIIEGIARGMLYLHDHSRLKVIHRDLKPGNILLDNDMNPKISDFGLAKMVAIDHAQGSTNRVVGTYGYMAPEYAMHGKFSTKSDIFSFGVIVLEIVSGKRNSCSFTSHRVDDLLSNAWKQWNNQTPLQILDPKLKESYAQNEVENCIQVGLLCVQEDPDVRPSMQTIISYFNGHSVKLPSPREPLFSSYS